MQNGNPKMKKLLNKIRKNEAGATAIEYGLIAALIAVAIITAVTSAGSNTSNVFSRVANSMGAVSR
jgi:pilus assembly protein Flp/PilA